MTKLFDINEAVCINLLDNLPGMFFRCLNDFRRTMLYASVGSKNLTGYSPEDFMGSEGISYGLLLHNQDRERVSLFWFDHAEKKEGCNIEYRIICREGRVRWVREFSNSIYDNAVNLKYIEGYVQEITTEKNSRLLTNAFTSYQKAINRGSIVSITDKAGYILYVNDLFCTYSKYSREELTGHNHNIINSGFHPPEFFADLWETISSGEIWRGEIKNKAKDGTCYWVDTVISPIFNDEGEVEQYFSVRNDITDKKEAIEALVRSESRLKEAQRIATIGNWELDIQKNHIYWSDEVYSIFEVKPEQFENTYEAFLNFLHPDDVESVNSAYTNSIVNKTAYDVVHRIILSDGRIKYLQERADTNYDELGMPVRTYGTVQDITSIKETELKLIKTNREYKQLVDHIKEGIMIDDISGKVVFANQQYLDLFGIDEKDLENLMLEDFVDVEYRSILRKRHNRRVRGEEVPGNFEYRGVRKDGTKIWLEVNVTLLEDDQGVIQGTQSIIRDITNKKKIVSDLMAKEIQLESMVAELTRKNTELEKVNNEIDRFVYSASHDLRAPLMSVIGLIDMCKEVGGESPELMELLDMMRASVNRSDDAIKSIINYSRNKKLDFNIEAISLKDIVENHIANIRFMKETEDVEFFVESNQDTEFFSDKLRVTTILVNLVTNAVKYQQKGNSHKQVQIGINVNLDKAVIKVTDNGEGIEPDMQEKVFDMFFRNSLNSDGSGLGLYISMEMATMLGGKITLQSELGVGSVFSVELPNWREDK